MPGGGHSGQVCVLAESYYNEERFALLLMAERNAYTRRNQHAPAQSFA